MILPLSMDYLPCLKMNIPRIPSPPPLITNNQLLYSSQKEKVVIVMGATGTGKSKLSIDIGSDFGGEAINSDKIQAYQGLHIITNKITDEESRGVPHHLLGEIHPDIDFTATNFCTRANKSLNSITRRNRLPIIVGGSNSFIEALVDNNFRTRFDCLFLWVHVEMPVLHSFVSDRVDKMVDRGLVEEAREFYSPNGDYSRGIRRAIGVPELDRYFRNNETSSYELTQAIDQIKVNTSRLACRQLEKIKRLNKKKAWRIHQLDATDVFRRRGCEAEEAWQELVGGPGGDIVRRFLLERAPGPVVYGGMKEVIMAGAQPLMAAASR